VLLLLLILLAQSGLAILVGLLALTVRILLLLAGLLATALLLTGLLTRVLVLLTRVLVLLARVLILVAHRVSPLLASMEAGDNARASAGVAREHRFRRDHCMAKP
jgi:hypothetical protein